MVKNMFMRLGIILAGVVLYAYLYQLYRQTIYYDAGSSYLLYYWLKMLTLFFMGMLLELAPFNSKMCLRNWHALLPVVILIGLFALALSGLTSGWWTSFNLVGISNALPLISLFIGFMLAKALKGEPA